MTNRIDVCTMIMSACGEGGVIGVRQADIRFLEKEAE